MSILHSQGRTYLYQAVTRRASICLGELVALNIALALVKIEVKKK